CKLGVIGKRQTGGRSPLCRRRFSTVRLTNLSCRVELLAGIRRPTGTSRTAGMPRTACPNRQFHCTGITCNYNPRLSAWGHCSLIIRFEAPPHVVGRHRLAAIDEQAVWFTRHIPVGKFKLSSQRVFAPAACALFVEVRSWLLRA